MKTAMIVGHRRKWRRLILGFLVLIIVGTVSLLSHLWTSTPGTQKDPLRKDYLNREGKPLHYAKDRADPRHDNKLDTVSGLDDNQLDADPQGDNENAILPQDDKRSVPLDDYKNAVPLDDDKNAVPQHDKNPVPLDDSQPTAELQDKIRNPQDDNQPDIVRRDGNNKIAERDNRKPTVPQDKILPDSVPSGFNQPDAVMLDKQRKDFKPRHGHRSFHRESGAKNPSKADLSKVDPPVNLFQPASAVENADKNNVRERVPDSPIRENLSAEDFIGKREENGLKNKLQLPTLPRNKIENVDSSAGVGSFESPEKPSSGKDSTKTLSKNEDVQKTLKENNVHAAANDVKTDTKLVLYPPSTSEKIRQSLLTKPNQDLSYQVLDEERYFQNSAFQPEKGSEAVGQKFSEDSFFSGTRNEMNKNDFAADAEHKVDIPLPMKSKFSETTNDSSWRADPNPTDEFDSWIKFTHKNSSNFPGSVGTSGGVRIVSMSLYGSDPRYTIGAIRNAELVKENFPGWTLRIYMESPTSSTPRFGLVPRNIREKLRNLGADIHYIVPEQDFIPPMMWRFLVADDLSVDYFIIRDSDSRLTDRDAAAVSAWIQSGKPFHSIRDHPSHAAYAVSGGLWGGSPKELHDILRRPWIDLMHGTSSNYLEDMNFLNSVIWPRVKDHAYCSDSVSCDRYPNSHPFPVARYGYDHVGQVFNEHDLGRPVDMQILKARGENSRCTPTNGS